MKVDICSICFNEEVLLRLWIESWLSVPFIGKINLVDGGSTDNTIRIAKEYKDRVNIMVVPWKNDFARQRNIAIKLAKAHWIIQPDIDEIPCKTLNDDKLSELLERDSINQIALPYVKFHDWKTLWMFNNTNTPNMNNDIVQYGFKSTITLFKKNHLSGYSKSLHEMPIFSGEEKGLHLYSFSDINHLGNHFLVGHYDQAKHFEQAKLNNRSVYYEMGLKRAYYRLINPATYEGKLFDKAWAEKAIKENNIQMIEELGELQYKEFLKQHTILKQDMTQLNNDIIKKYLEK